jgi:hypothetical protein
MQRDNHMLSVPSRSNNSLHARKVERNDLRSILYLSFEFAVINDLFNRLPMPKRLLLGRHELIS